MQSVPNVLKYEKPRDRNPLGFSKHNDRISIIMRGFIVLHGIRIAKDFVPETFSRLTTIGPRFRLPVGKQGNRQSFQVCQCVCGCVGLVNVNYLKTGHTKSCGCLSSELTSQRNTKHGMCGTPEYYIWHAMKARCCNNNSSNYEYYGGRGVTVCDRWLDPKNGFANFLADMGLRPEGAYSIERKEVNGNYYPGNCCWATVEQQARNKRDNHNIIHKGKTQCLTAWAEEVGMNYYTLKTRIRRGWSADRALTTPVKKIAGQTLESGNVVCIE